MKRKKKRIKNMKKKVAMTIRLLIITLNLNGLNSPVKRHRVAGWIRKQDLTCAACKRLASDRKTHGD